MSEGKFNCAAPAVEYREVVGFPGYRVGDDGSVWSCWERHGYGAPRGGTYLVIGSRWRRLKFHIDHSGYHRIEIKRDGVRHNLGVHQLVLQAFVGPCPPGMVVRHFPDSDVSNNSLENLRWGTPAENAADKNIHGTSPRGERCGQAVLSGSQVREIRDLIRDGVSQVEIARRFNISRSNVSAIKKGKSWAHYS